MHVQGTEIHIFAWGKQGLNCLPFWCLALTMGLLTGWEWLSLWDVISLLISNLSPLGEQWGPCPGDWDPAELRAANAHPWPSKQRGWMSLEGVCVCGFCFGYKCCLCKQCICCCGKFCLWQTFFWQKCRFADIGISLHFTNGLNCNELLFCNCVYGQPPILLRNFLTFVLFTAEGFISSN